MANKVPQFIIIDEATEIDVIAFKKLIARPIAKKKGKWLDSNKNPENWISGLIPEKVRQ